MGKEILKFDNIEIKKKKKKKLTIIRLLFFKEIKKWKKKF